MSFLTLRSSLGALSAEQDWINRSTAAGVVYATDFRDAEEVSDWTFPNSGASRVTQYSGDSITGGYSLRIDTPAALGNDNNSTWCHPLSSAWVTDQQGFGDDEWYMQVRIKLAPNRLTCGSNGGGFKVFNVGEVRPQSFSNSRSHPNGEVVLTSYATYDLIPWLYRDIDFSQDPLSTSAGGSDLYLQPALDNGSGISDPDERYCIWRSGITDIGPGCYRWPVDEWLTIDMATRLPGRGSGNSDPLNRLRLWITGAGETVRRPLWDSNGFTIGADAALPLGNNGIWLLAFDTGRTSSSEDTYQLYGQLIVSTQPIALPV